VRIRPEGRQRGISSRSLCPDPASGYVNGRVRTRARGPARDGGPEEAKRPWGPTCLTACFPAVARGTQEDPVFLPSPLRIIATLGRRHKRHVRTSRRTRTLRACARCSPAIRNPELENAIRYRRDRSLGRKFKERSSDPSTTEDQ
jgi:hypothetical protein